MPEVILGGNVGVRIASESQDVLDAFVLKNTGKRIDLIFVVMQACEVYHRFDLVLVLDLLCELDGAVAIGRSAGAERDADEVRIELSENT